GELGEPLAAQWLAELEQPAGLDLPDALARDAVDLGHLVERPRLAIPQAEAQLDHLALARRQRPQHLADALAQQMLVGALAGRERPVVAQELLQRPLALTADR